MVIKGITEFGGGGTKGGVNREARDGDQNNSEGNANNGCGFHGVKLIGVSVVLYYYRRLQNLI